MLMSKLALACPQCVRRPRARAGAGAGSNIWRPQLELAADTGLTSSRLGEHLAERVEPLGPVLLEPRDRCLVGQLRVRECHRALRLALRQEADRDDASVVPAQPHGF